MDTSEKYIKMCEKGKEIQKHIPGKWDIYCIDFTKSEWLNVRQIEMTYWNSDFDGNDIWEIPFFELDRTWDKRDKGIEKIWLPRQDQLQEMVLDTSCVENLLSCFYWWMHKDMAFTLLEFDSLEQWWLAFVMHEKYGKIWDDKRKDWLR